MPESLRRQAYAAESISPPRGLDPVLVWPHTPSSPDPALLSSALAAVRSGNLAAAQTLIDRADGPPMTLDQVFRLYQSELEAQAQQLRDSQRHTQEMLDWVSAMFETLPVAALRLDGRGMILEANATACAELGLDRLPFPVRRLMATADAEVRLASLLGQVMPGQAMALDDIGLRTVKGEPRWADLRVTLAPRHHSDPGAASFLCVFSDRTVRVEAARANAARVTAEHERDVARSASEAKTQLLSRVSHELRTPLNAVIGFSQLLLMAPDALAPDVDRKVRHISDAGQHLLALVDEVLEINTAEGGQLTLHTEAVNVAAVAQQVLDLQAPAAAVAQVSLTLAAAAEGGADALSGGGGGGAVDLCAEGDGADATAAAALARADVRRVREVLTNLVSNAIKYNRSGGAVCVGVTQDATHVRVAVRDTGIGLTAEQVAHLFEPFNRLGAEKLKVAGTGLGLSIARSLAVAMGGQLAVCSVPGEGSEFVLVLPRWRVG